MLIDNKSIFKSYNNPLSLLLLFSSFAAAFNFQLNYFRQQMQSITMTMIMMTKSQNSESNNNNNYLRYLNNCFSFTCHSMRFDSIRLYNSSMPMCACKLIIHTTEWTHSLLKLSSCIILYTLADSIRYKWAKLMKFSIAINCSIWKLKQTLKSSCGVIKIKFNDISNFVRMFCCCTSVLLCCQFIVI